MALGALTLSVTSGVQGRPFQATINGLTTGRVEVLGDGSPGFSTVNGKVMSQGLPYPVSTIVLREYEPGVGAGFRDSRIDIVAATRDSLMTQALASLAGGRTLQRYRVAGTRQSDGSIVYSLIVEDDLGATVGLTPSGNTPTPTPTPTLNALNVSNGSGTVGSVFTSTISGLTSGSSVALTGTGAAGLSITGATITGTPATAGAVNIVETLAGATNSPRTTSGAITVAAAGGSVLPQYATAVFFGDSITVGVDSSTNAKRWSSLVAATVGAVETNQAISGTVLQNSPDAGGSARASNGRDRYATALLGANKKAAAFIAYGFNDARYVGAPTTFNVAEYANDYREVLNGLIIGGYAPADIYVIDPYYISDTGLTTGSTGFAGQTRSGFEAYVTAAQAVAAEFGVKSAPIYAYLRDNGFAATTTGDAIHPNDTGHALIANGVSTLAMLANTRATPTVTSSVSAQTVTVVASAVSGAASYEYELITNPVRTASNTTGSFTNVAAGSYYGKARAVFGDGTKGPWGFTASAVTVSASQSVAITGTPGPATQNTPYSFTPNVTGGSGTKSFTQGGTLPTGLTFSTSTGSISGTPTATGTFSGISITVNDSGGTSATLSNLTITVAAASARTARGVTESYGSTADGTLLTATTPTLGTWTKNAFSTGEATIMANAITGGPTAQRIVVEHFASAAYGNGQYAKGTLVVRSDTAGLLSTALVMRSDTASQTFLGILYNGQSARVVKYTNGVLGLLGTPIASALGAGTYAVDIQAIPANAGADCVLSGTINGVSFSYTVAESSLPALGTGMGIRTQTGTGAAWTNTTGPVFTSIEVGSVN